jgi:hypothetical protein
MTTIVRDNRTATEIHRSHEHLVIANRVRMARAALKRQVNAGELSVADVLLDHMDTCENMTLLELLSSQFRWGRGRSLKFLRPLALSPGKRLGDLTERQTALIVNAL